MKKPQHTLKFILLSLAILMLACSLPVSLPNMKLPGIERGSGTVITEERPISGVEKLVINGAGEVFITQGTVESLMIEAEDNVLPKITSEIEGNTLIIGFDNTLWQDKLLPTKVMKYYLTVLDLTTITINGAVTLKNDSLETARFELEINGAGDFDFNGLKVGELIVKIIGSGSVKMIGEAENQSVTINGAGNYDAGDLLSSSTVITFNGAGDAKVWATDRLEMSIGGVGSISYYGSPEVTQNITGIGTIKDLGEK